MKTKTLMRVSLFLGHCTYHTLRLERKYTCVLKNNSKKMISVVDEIWRWAACYQNVNGHDAAQCVLQCCFASCRIVIKMPANESSNSYTTSITSIYDPPLCVFDRCCVCCVFSVTSCPGTRSYHTRPGRSSRCVPAWLSSAQFCCSSSPAVMSTRATAVPPGGGSRYGLVTECSIQWSRIPCRYAMYCNAHTRNRNVASYYCKL